MDLDFGRQSRSPPRDERRAQVPTTVTPRRSAFFAQPSSAAKVHSSSARANGRGSGRCSGIVGSCSAPITSEVAALRVREEQRQALIAAQAKVRLAHEQELLREQALEQARAAAAKAAAPPPTTTAPGRAARDDYDHCDDNDSADHDHDVQLPRPTRPRRHRCQVVIRKPQRSRCGISAFRTSGAAPPPAASTAPASSCTSSPSSGSRCPTSPPPSTARESGRARPAAARRSRLLRLGEPRRHLHRQRPRRGCSGAPASSSGSRTCPTGGPRTSVPAGSTTPAAAREGSVGPLTPQWSLAGTPPTHPVRRPARSAVRRSRHGRAGRRGRASPLASP